MKFLLRIRNWITNRREINRAEEPARTHSEDRSPTESERALIHWLIEYGAPEAKCFQEQVDYIHVVGSCGCGCPTIDLSVEDGVSQAGYAPHILADFIGYTPEGWQVGILLFQTGGKLSCLEVYNLSEHEGRFSLPDVSTLKSWESLR